MSHTIIVGIDGSANSDCALKWALKHAQLSGASIHLVAAYTVPGVNMSQADIVYPEDFDTAVKDSTQALAEAAAQVVRDAGVEVTTTVSPGDASGVLVESSNGADLAVVGARGRGGFAGRLLGSVALAMPAHAQCPTVVIPSTWPDRSKLDKPLPNELPVRTHDAPDSSAAAGRSQPDHTGEVIAAIDPFETDTPVLRDAAVQAKLYGIPLHLVGITATHILSPEWMPSEAHLEKMYDRASALMAEAAKSLADEFPDVEVRWSIFDAPTTEVLINSTRTADLLVIGSRGRTGFVATLLGSTSQGVLAHSACPTRVVRVPPRKHTKKG